VCADIETRVLSSGVQCVYACSGLKSEGWDKCNHPPQLLPVPESRLYQ
jgi:hypothetical protein